MLLLVLTREDGETSIKLGQDAPKTPHINGHVVTHPKDNLWGPVESTLDVSIDLFVFKATASKVNDLQGALGGVEKQHILQASSASSSLDASTTYLGLEITMYNLVLTHQHKRCKHLGRESTNKRRREPGESVGLDELVQVDAQQLSDDAQVVAERKVFVHLQDMILLLGILRANLAALNSEKNQRTHFFKLSRILISTRAW